MEKLRYSLLTAMLIIGSFISVIYISCTADKCEGITCQNGGSCNEGTCACPAGYSGAFCQEPVVTDPCENVTCQNGGTCNDGNCVCPAGYEGDNCELTINAKFAGTYNVLENCTMNGNSSYTVTIVTDAGQPNGVLVYNLGNYASCMSGAIKLHGTVNGNSIAIDTSACGYHFVANGTLNGDQLQLTYSATYGPDTESCTANLQK